MINSDMNGITLGTVNAGLAKGTTSTITTAAASAGMINGKFVTPVAAAANVAAPILDAATGLPFIPLGPNKATVLVYGQNAAGVLLTAQGQIVDTEVGITVTPGAFKYAPQFPSLPNDFMVIGYVLVRTAPDAAAWTPGTSAWLATGVTASAVIACGALPSTPQIA